MNNASPPTPAPASLASSRSTQHNRPNFAFLVHSMDTLPQNLPPDADNKSLARQKRRRTSPEDQATLEEAYRRNSKPDKAARMSIVARVALGEKEVQIWFQNRRQSTRRKSRPLLPHELLASQSSSSSTEQNSPGSSQEDQAVNQDSTSVSPDTITDNGPNRENRRAQPTCVGLETLIGEIAPSGNEGLDSSQTGVSASRDLDAASFLDSSVTWARNSQSYVLSQDKQTTCPPGVGYISNRRNGPFSAHGAKPKVPPILKSATPCEDQEEVIPKVHSLLKRTSSLVRLSMSLDGKAQVLTGAELSPPHKDSVIRPRASSRANTGLQRSQSLVESGEKAAMSRSNSFSQIPRPLLNSRAGVLRTTWDFYCDGDARSAISATAKAEQSGDAAGAIEQIRKTRMVVNQKRTALSSKTGPTKRVRAGEATTNKPNIVRTSSSFARLQTETHDPKKQHKSGKQLPTKLHQGSMGSPSGDSDKENWLPGTQRPRPILRRTGGSGEGPVRVPRPVLEQLTGERRMNSPMSTHCFGSGPPLSYERVDRVPPRTILNENESPSNDSTEQRKTSSLDVPRVARGEEDLDCVQNLLSLSQGAWR